MSKKPDLNLFLFLSLNMVFAPIGNAVARWGLKKTAKAGLKGTAKAGLKSGASIASKGLSNLTVKVAGSRLGLGAGLAIGAGGLVIISEFFTNFDPLPDIPILTPFIDSLKDFLGLEAITTTMFIIIVLVIVGAVAWIVLKFRGGK
jgi:hypothetical protein